MTHTPINGGVCAPQGFRAAGIHCGIRKNKNKRDLALIVSDCAAATAAVYTRNKVQGAPLALTRRHLADGFSRAVLCNSGNANTCNPDGLQIAEQCCELAARALGVLPEEIVIASTGVIGQPLPLAPFEQGIPAAVSVLSADGGADAAEAVMTTDTRPKSHALAFDLDGTPCRIGIITKGSGMINPNMATMLTFITTDAAITPALLQRALSATVDDTLNQINIDGDTSTNDMAVIQANGMAGNAEINDENSAAYAAFCAALHAACVWACREIAADGEGATKLLECTVQGAPDARSARAVAKSIISSDLLKAAMFGEDANWGRVLCAIGYTEGDFAADKVSLTLASDKGSVKVCENSAYFPFSEDEAAEVLSAAEIRINVDLHDGTASAQAWGCDLSYDYVKINGDYRS
ncbi:bifunctional glutamate N-acetyltransferase/amino-acid acetyltransferase ArgJ [Conchiformibius kuhniae]|uniref:Arginine biosynthesis bifunctional protein ArgJ n=2 Tax=Conchiformibius kuhniae TaxID=211502 RepID=A0ABD8B8C5_9NEIS|nr:bifunctional glutamate N-acetyltransferase/amino-acid acetyltransferase ArgJ [Conchiformibius kuhniae]